MKVDVIRVTICSGMGLTSHTGMAQALPQLPVTKEKQEKSSIFTRRVVLDTMDTDLIPLRKDHSH